MPYKLSNIFSTVRHFALLSAFIAVIWSINALAWPPTYGAEFEFGNAAMREKSIEDNSDVKTTYEVKTQLIFAKYMEEHCLIAKCTVKPVYGKFGTSDFVVTYEDGWWFKISKDPGCIEITFKPSTLAELESRAHFINEEIFKTAAAVGLDVKFDDSAHFNIGIRSAFLDDGKNFLRFFVDYANHPDLALGSLGKDINNGPPLSILNASQRQALQEIIQETELGKWRTIAQIANQIQQRVYTESYNKSWGGIEHYQVVGLKIVNKTNLTKDDAPMELRAVWSQMNAEHFCLVAKLMEGRIQYLNKLSAPIVYTQISRDSFTNTELLTRFTVYVREAGLSVDDYLSLLPTEVRNARIDDFLKTTIKPERRLLRAEAYWDLILTSPMIRSYFIDLISDPQVMQSPVAQKIIIKLNTLLEKATADAAQPAQNISLFSKIKSLWSKTEPPSDPKLKIYQEILDGIEKSHAKKIQTTRISVRCEGLFLNFNF